jgi:hypothetical protein
MRSPFEPRYICKECGKPAPEGEEPDLHECSCLASRFELEDCRRFLEDARTEPIRISRRDGVNVAHRFVHHSPTGFAWGYGGSGPSDLALNILAEFVPPPEAYRLHQQFKWDVVARIPWEGTTIPAEDVRRWIEEQWRKEEQAA